MGRCIDEISTFNAQGLSTIVWSLAKMNGSIKLLPNFVETMEQRCSSKYSSEEAAREWSTVVIVIVICMT